jgi:hypothetical protein
VKPRLRDGLGVLIGLTALAALVRFATLDLRASTTTRRSPREG